MESALFQELGTWNSCQYLNVSSLKSHRILRVSMVSDICGQLVGVEWLIWLQKKKGSFWKISLKSVAIEMQGLFLREPSWVLSADGLPYVLCLHPYNLPRHPIWPCISLNSVLAYLISFIINWWLCCKFTRAVLASRKGSWNGELFESLMKAVDPQVL